MVAYSAEANIEARTVDLELAHEARQQAQARTTEYQRRIKRAFHKRVSPQQFEQGDLVLRKVEATGKHVGKLEPNWEGPFQVVDIRGKGAYELQTLDGRTLPRPWNIGHLRRFYV